MKERVVCRYVDVKTLMWRNAAASHVMKSHSNVCPNANDIHQTAQCAVNTELKCACSEIMRKVVL